jgi:hypothetical protein
MEWLMLLVLGGAGGAGAYAAQRARVSRAERRASAEELDQVRQVADEDVTVFGEQLRRLGHHVAEVELDERGREDYQVALDAYEHAKREVTRIDRFEQVSSLVDTLATGRYAMVCVRARVAGEPVPELTVPCFFNPQHGPSDHKVMWTSSRTGTRRVPACSRCAAQVTAREKPEVFMIGVGGRKVPYWEAGATYHPYSRGYFPEGQASTSAMMWMYASPDAALLGLTGYDGPSFGAHGSMDAGGFDPGGGDGGGSN